VAPAVVTSFFGPRLDPLDGRPRYHLGLDLQAREGQDVTAAADGVVVSAGWAGGHGNRVEVLHESGVVTGYSHLSSIVVQRGERVARGQAVGLAGHTGRVTGPHLHFEVWRDGEPQDPLDLLPDAASVEVVGAAPLD
jgi:murein DD-endopeptidase MepM/ murein hydrolase activator NlpD